MVHYLRERYRSRLPAPVALIKDDRVDVFAQTDGRCFQQPGPCGEVSCRHHLWEGRQQDLAEPCVLRLVDREGPMTLEAVARKMGLTRERIRQIEAKALLRLRAKVPSDDNDCPPSPSRAAA